MADGGGGLCLGNAVGKTIEKTLAKDYDASILCEKNSGGANDSVREDVKRFYVASDSDKLFDNLCPSSSNTMDDDNVVVAKTVDAEVATKLEDVLTGEEDCRKKRCVDRYDSSESSDSGVATLSCTDCSASSTASSDITDPGSPFSTASNHSEDSGSASQPAKMPPTQNGHHPPWPWRTDESLPLKRQFDEDDKTDSFSKKLKLNNTLCTAETINNNKTESFSLISSCDRHQLVKSSLISKINSNKSKAEANRLQQGKITEYFKSHVKPTSNGLKNALKNKLTYDHGTQFNSFKQNLIQRTAKEVKNVRANKRTVVKNRKVSVPRKILPAPSKTNEKLLNHHHHVNNITNFPVITAVSFPTNLTYIHKVQKPPDMFVPQYANAIPCLNVLQPVQKLMNNFNCVKLNTPTTAVVPVVKLNNLNNLPCRVNGSTNNTSSNNISSNSSICVESALPSVLSARTNLKIGENKTLTDDFRHVVSDVEEHQLENLVASLGKCARTEEDIQEKCVTGESVQKKCTTNGERVHEKYTSTGESVQVCVRIEESVQEMCTRTGDGVEETYTRTGESVREKCIFGRCTPSIEESASACSTQIVFVKVNTSSDIVDKLNHSGGAGKSPSDSDSGFSSMRESLEISVVGDESAIGEQQQPQKSPILSQPKTIRFPARRIEDSKKNANKDANNKSHLSDTGRCRWNDCSAHFETSGALLEHLQIKHVISQASQDQYVCFWLGCKVHGRTSCSRTWLERHVLAHAGTKPFRCIVEGCGQRFNSQLTLQRHVNGHFNSDGSPTNSAKKTVESSASKLLKRNGKKVRFRRQPWSARMFDFIDAGIMEGLQNKLVSITEKRTLGQNGVTGGGDTVNLHSQILARRIEKDGNPKVLVRWHPTDIVSDEWIIEKDLKPIKIVPIPTLHPAAKNALNPSLFSEEKRKHRRKPSRKSATTET